LEEFQELILQKKLGGEKQSQNIHYSEFWYSSNVMLELSLHFIHYDCTFERFLQNIIEKRSPG